MKQLAIITLLCICRISQAQFAPGDWALEQIGTVTWQKTYVGVLADFHPVTIMLATDQNQVAGYLVHKGDQRKHRLLGDWSSTRQFELQERDENGRLTGYLTGSVTDDLVEMDWISSDHNRMFTVKAFPENLVRIKNFKPVAETIQVAGAANLFISVQKLDYGIVSGTVNNNGHYSRFEGYCLDGACSLWNTVFQSPSGIPVKVQMRQKDAQTYRVSLNSAEHQGTIKAITPLVLQRFDNSAGFLDFTYPGFASKGLDQWLDRWLGRLWTNGVNHLAAINTPEHGARLIHRSSGWVEILDETDQYVSGMVTYINPGITHRETFLWLRKEDVFLSQAEMQHTQDDLKKCSAAALKMASHFEDPEYREWVTGAGHIHFAPVGAGVVMATGFNMIYGDDLRLVRTAEAKMVLKKKYWKYFGW